MIAGHATPEATAAYAKRIASAHPDHWRPALGLTLSSLGMGTYLGEADEATDAAYVDAALKALELGINVIDSAVNYRFQRSERSIGAALRKAIEGGRITREEVLLCTKGGFVSGDGAPPDANWLNETFIKPGIITAGEIVGGCHCMTPKYLRHEIEQSRRNLGVETIDVYYLHNPDTQMPEIGPDEYYPRLTEAFRTLEASAAEGRIRWYGTATWNAYRVPEGEPTYCSLKRTLTCAEEAGGKDHRFRVVQLPFNFGMMEAAMPHQALGGKQTSALEAAHELGLTIFTSVPLVQGQILGRIPPDVKARMPGLSTDAQRCLQFVRSTPGILAPLCGMKSVAHVEENAKIIGFAPLPPEA